MGHQLIPADLIFLFGALEFSQTGVYFASPNWANLAPASSPSRSFSTTAISSRTYFLHTFHWLAPKCSLFLKISLIVSVVTFLMPPLQAFQSISRISVLFSYKLLLSKYFWLFIKFKNCSFCNYTVSLRMIGTLSYSVYCTVVCSQLYHRD